MVWVNRVDDFDESTKVEQEAYGPNLEAASSRDRRRGEGIRLLYEEKAMGEKRNKNEDRKTHGGCLVRIGARREARFLDFPATSADYRARLMTKGASKCPHVGDSSSSPEQG